jgi:hypothetical protein
MDLGRPDMWHQGMGRIWTGGQVIVIELDGTLIDLSMMLMLFGVCWEIQLGTHLKSLSLFLLLGDQIFNIESLGVNYCLHHIIFSFLLIKYFFLSEELFSLDTIVEWRSLNFRYLFNGTLSLVEILWIEKIVWLMASILIERMHLGFLCGHHISQCLTLVHHLPIRYKLLWLIEALLLSGIRPLLCSFHIFSSDWIHLLI